MMSPYELRLLLHVYAIAEPLPERDSQVRRDALAWMVTDKLIEPYDGGSGYRTTDKGDAWVQAILAVPQPIQKWVQP